MDSKRPELLLRTALPASCAFVPFVLAQGIGIRPVSPAAPLAGGALGQNHQARNKDDADAKTPTRQTDDGGRGKCNKADDEHVRARRIRREHDCGDGAEEARPSGDLLRDLAADFDGVIVITHGSIWLRTGAAGHRVRPVFGFVGWSGATPLTER